MEEMGVIDEGVRVACEGYVGRSREVWDAMSPAPGRRLEALLDRVPSLHEGDALPVAWHWAYLVDEVRQSDIGPEGHERLGLFLPPVPFHRRMWAASDIVLTEPLILGRPAIRRSTIRSVEFKSGRSGPLCFVQVSHGIEQDGRPRIGELQTIVYRDGGPVEPAWSAPQDSVPEGFLLHDDAQLLRYSAVTHNAHRIHWDRDFCRSVEGYPDLVVHGPLLATRLAQALQARRGEMPTRFSFRAVAPVLVTTPVQIETAADGTAGRVLRPDGREAMTGTMAWGSSAASGP